MQNFFNIKILELRRKYVKTYKHSENLILRELIIVAYSNNGFLPNSFKIPLNQNFTCNISTVLQDLGYPHIRSIRSDSNSSYIDII